MNRLRQIFRRVRSLFQKPRLDAEMAEEMRAHLEMQTQANLAAGMTPEKARYAAMRQFGGVEQIKERCREQRGWVWLEQSVKDLHHGLRQLAKAPVFTGIAVLSLALGIGANTAVFTTIEALFLRGLPVRDPQELVRLGVIGFHSVGGRLDYFSYPSYEQFRDHAQSLAEVIAVNSSDSLSSVASGVGESDAVPARVDEVSGNFFPTLGVPAVLGRSLTPEDDRSNAPRAVVVLSYACWQSRFGADPSVLGKTILLENVPFSIVGVAPAGFFGVVIGRQTDLWIPVQMIPIVSPRAPSLRSTGSYWLPLMGRLRPGFTREMAATELDLLFQRDIEEMLAEHPQFADYHAKFDLQPGGSGYFLSAERNRALLTILMAVTGLVLIVACANVTSLQLARIAGRQRELAVLAALGAGRARLIWRLMTESLLIAAIGGTMGLLLAHWGTQALFNYAPDLPRMVAPTPDGRVLLFAILISTAAAICTGLIPALRFSQVDLVAAIKVQAHTHTGGAGQRMSKTLVTVQIALSICLLAGAGLLVRTLENLKNVDLGFRRDNLLLFSIGYDATYDGVRRAALSTSVLSALEALPGVRSATFGIGGMLTSAPLGPVAIHVVGYVSQQGEQMDADFHYAGPRYFETLGIPLRHGRGFGDADMVPVANQPISAFAKLPPNPNAPVAPSVAVVNEALARRYFGADDPIGHVIRVGAGIQAFRIIGVAKNTAFQDLRETSYPEIYVPAPLGVAISFQLHTTGDPLSLASTIRAVIRRIDPKVKVLKLGTGEELLDTLTSRERMIAQISSCFSLFALTLACLGLYGVLAYNVIQRTREIGVRMALGARTGDIASLVIKQGATLALIGCALGVAAAAALSRFIVSSLYGVSGTDPLTLAAVVMLLVLVALLASWLPARRATRVNPIMALRAE